MKKVISNNCLECGQTTKNPKFCSRNCAAKYNNHTTPKRSPEGRCKKCGAAVLAKVSVCKNCRLEKAIEKKRRQENRHILQTENGFTERTFPRCSLDSVVVFEWTKIPPGRRSSKKKGSAGEFLENLVAATLDIPGYLHGSHLKRTANLLQSLFEFRSEQRSYRSGKTILRHVRDLPLEELGAACYNWVRSFFGEGNHALTPTFALAVSIYVKRHLYGHHSLSAYGRGWKINPYDEDIRDRCRNGFNFIYDKTFKKEFTWSMGEILVQFEVPLGVKLIANPRFGRELSLLPQVLMKCERCYLSQDFYDYYRELKVGVPEEREFDIFSDFSLPGAVFYSPPENKYSYRLLRGELPAEWAKGVIEPDIDGNLVELPVWLR